MFQVATFRSSQAGPYKLGALVPAHDRASAPSRCRPARTLGLARLGLLGAAAAAGLLLLRLRPANDAARPRVVRALDQEVLVLPHLRGAGGAHQPFSVVQWTNGAHTLPCLTLLQRSAADAALTLSPSKGQTLECSSHAPCSLPIAHLDKQVLGELLAVRAPQHLRW